MLESGLTAEDNRLHFQKPGQPGHLGEWVSGRVGIRGVIYRGQQFWKTILSPRAARKQGGTVLRRTMAKQGLLKRKISS